MPAESVLIALTLALLAGLATAIGSTMAFFSRRTNTRFLAMALGFSAGIMIYVSFVKLLPDSLQILTGAWAQEGETATVAALFGGMLLAALIDRSVPLGYNPHEIHRVEDRLEEAPRDERLMHLGLVTALAIAVHNFPEGFATFISSLHDTGMGLSVALAVGIHNIPEGIAVSVPLYYATGNRRLAFGLSALSGLSEPLGALLGYAVLAGFWSETLLALTQAAVAGIMIFISFDLLLPAAHSFGDHHRTVYALIGGMAVMALSLLLF